MPVADYEKKYPFCAKETRGLTMRDAEWAFQLSPDPPKVKNLNDYIFPRVLQKHNRAFLTAPENEKADRSST